MSFILTSPITGTAQTGLTSPTYTLTNDTAPDNNGRQYAVTALGGTQSGVLPHTVASPFTVTGVRPRVLRALGAPGSNGVISQVPNNVYRVITRKGVIPAANQVPRVMIVETIIHVPAGSDTYDANSVRAALSAHLGALSQQSAGIGDLTISGIL